MICLERALNCVLCGIFRPGRGSGINGLDRFFCARCTESIQSSSRRQPCFILEIPSEKTQDLLVPVCSLFRYSGALRTLLHRAKIKDDFFALKALSALGVYCFKKLVDLKKLPSDFDAICVAPSSAWGRFRGRFDVACVFAAEIASLEGLPILKMPSKLYWRFGKRARLRDRKRFVVARCMRENGKNDLAPHFVDNKIVDKKNSKKILLVDDVVTTGWTVAQVSQSLAQMVHKGGHQFEMHVLALASGLSGPIE